MKVADRPRGEQPVTRRRRQEGVWSTRHSRAQQMYGCAEGGFNPNRAFEWDCLIVAGETYWRHYGVMAEAFQPHTIRVCERHQQEWEDRYGE